MSSEDESGDVLEGVEEIHPVVDRLRRLLASATLLDLKASTSTYWTDQTEESDRSFFWTPSDPRLDRWREIYLAVSDQLGVAADAGRWLLRWAVDAGLTDAAYTTSTWTFATPADRAWWGDLWAERILTSNLAGQAVEFGVATRAELEEVSDGWRAWGGTEHGTFVVVHGEVLARTPG